MALERMAAIQPGDRVLVHAAAGGVGLAAIQVVQAKGAVVVATAGGTAKRSLLHGMGVQHVLGSRDTAFVSEAAQLGGATVVLNSLTSSGMVAGSLATLAAGGRFVEISKRDIWSAARVAQGELGLLTMAFLTRVPTACKPAFFCACSQSPPCCSHWLCFSTAVQSVPMCATHWWLLTSCLPRLSTPHSPASAAGWPRACCNPSPRHVALCSAVFRARYTT